MLDILINLCYSYLCRRETGARTYFKSHRKLIESF
nr:MAG TPA: hypothetical protein [Caudoviricetes sp.]